MVYYKTFYNKATMIDFHGENLLIHIFSRKIAVIPALARRLSLKWGMGICAEFVFRSENYPKFKIVRYAFTFTLYMKL